MKRDEIYDLAEQVWGAGEVYIGPGIENLMHFAELVIAAEREACAKVCEEMDDSMWNAYEGDITYTDWKYENNGARLCEAAIRARGDTE